MKHTPYLRHFLYAFVFATAFIVGLVVFPIAYFFRKWTRRKKFWPLLIWLNSDEPNEISNDYGDEGWRARKGIDIHTKSSFGRFLVSYRWAAIRNPHYNLKLLLAPKHGAIYDIKVKSLKGNAGSLTFRDYNILGKQHITYRIRGWKYFRYSFTKPISIFGAHRLWNIQLGTNKKRYIYKMRFGRY